MIQVFLLNNYIMYMKIHNEKKLYCGQKLSKSIIIIILKIKI